MIPGETVRTGARAGSGFEMRLGKTPAGWYVGFFDFVGTPFTRETEYFATEAEAEEVLMAMKDIDVEEWHTIDGIRL